MSSKQVLVMKKFPKSRNMRTGKYIAQGAHASMGAIFSLGKFSLDKKQFIIDIQNDFVSDWLSDRFTKIACYVETDDELRNIQKHCEELYIPSALITDAGLTEFNGVPTLTAVGVGPHYDWMIDKVTGHLPLF